MGIKIAVAGCGWIAVNSHGPACQAYAAEHEGVELAACCDVDPARADLFREKYGFRRSYTDYLDMLDKEKPVAVCLNVPEQFLCEMGCQIMQRGYALSCEKPPGLSLEEIDQLIDTARSTGVIHQVAFNRRFSPLMVELKRKLEGLTIQHYQVEFTRVGRTRSDFATTAVHAVDAVRFLGGSDYRRILFSYQEMPELGPGVANYFLACQMAGGQSAQLNFFPAWGENVERYTVYAEHNTLVLGCNLGQDAPGYLRHFNKGLCVYDENAIDYTRHKEDIYLSGFYAEDAGFFDAVQAGIQPVHDFSSCRQSVEVMQCLRERRKEYQTSINIGGKLLNP
jgi:myo-inositol 2-dehydrogenase / D-chiro-inositol 1-dehydrogenase